MYTSEEILEKINQGLADLNLEGQPSGLYQPIRYVLNMGGKRLRPVLMLMAYNLYRDDIDTILTTAVGLETYHNYTLLHDDVMDRADVRRGKPCVHRVWNDNTAILSGDTMLVMAYRFVAECQSMYLPEILKIFTQTALEIGEGQQYDVDFETRMDVSIPEYIEMIRLKTSVLLACALKMGAIQAGAPMTDSHLLYEFGEKIGLAFQLQDDLLDVYGDYATFGKKIGGDILCNKKTYLLITALEKADDAQRGELVRWIAMKEYDPQEKIDAVTEIYNQIGVKDFTQELINKYFHEAESLLERINLPEERKLCLWGYVSGLLGRQK